MAVQRSPKPPMGVRFPPTLPLTTERNKEMNPKEYLSGVAAEAKRVTWPGKRELWESTLVVISFIFILAVATLACDKAIEACLNMIKS